MQVSKYFGDQRRKARFNRVVMRVVLLLLAIQFMGTAHHRHDYLDTKTDCAACNFVQHLPFDLPPLVADAAPSLTLVSWPSVVFDAYVFFAQRSYLIPRGQAPPSPLFSI